VIFCQTERQKSKDKRLVSVVSIGFIENIKKMKRRLIILFCFAICAISSQAQVQIATTRSYKTVEYSYDRNGKLVKNFDANKNVELDSVKNTIQGTWEFKEYKCWEKEVFTPLPTIITFEKDTVRLIQSNFFDMETFKGTFEILPDKVGGTQININTIEDDILKHQKIELLVMHCEKNIYYFTILTHKISGIVTYHGEYKMTRIK